MTHQALARQAVIAGLAALLLIPAAPAETLYNGIELPKVWPPQLSALSDALPVPPVIPIDVGRQLFIDDFLVESTTLTRRFHLPVYHPASPVVAPDRDWEKAGNAPMAQPFSGGVWFDPADKKFKMWYMGGYNQHLCYAESADGVAWVKPALGVVKGTNIVLPGGATESNTVWLDLGEKDRKRRVKFFTHRGGAIGNFYHRASPDGIRGWTAELWESGRCGDRTTAFFDPFRSKWVLSVRESYPPGNRGRAKRYWEVGDINDPAAVAWPSQDRVPLWVTADRGLDAPEPALGVAPQLYHLDCVGYESVLLGLFSILRGNYHADGGEGRRLSPGRPKHNDVCVGYTRDGFHWYRPDHRVFLPLSHRKGDWNWGNVQSTGGGVLVVGDYLYIYCSARAGEAHAKGGELSYDASGSTGLAVLRRDGFAPMDAGTKEGTLTTRKLRFKGKHLFVNAETSAGELRAEVLDADGRAIAPFTKENCTPVRANATLQPVSWEGAGDLTKVSGDEVRFRFSLSNGSLYAFWVSPDANGASRGFVGAGGPGFASHEDTVGTDAPSGNRPPLADAGADQTVRAGAGQESAEVTLDATRSVDADGTIKRFEWRLGDKVIATGSKPAVKLPAGEHTLALTVTDDRGGAGVAGTRVTILPATDPAPPRHRLVLWLKADALTGLEDGAAVETWPDSAKNGLDPYQPDAKKRPVWRAKAVNGRPAVRFDGADDNLRTRYYRDLMFTSYKLSVFAVFRPAGAVETRGLVGSNFTTLHTTREKGGGLAYSTVFTATEGETNWLDVNPAPAGRLRPDRWSLGAVIRSGDRSGQTRLFVNGARCDDGTAIPYHSMNATHGHIGCLRGETGCWKGDIAEVLIYGDSLSETDREAVERYLSEKYGLGGKE